MKKKEYEEIKMVSEKFLCKNGKELKLSTIGPKEAEQFLKFMKQVTGETHFMSRSFLCFQKFRM